MTWSAVALCGHRKRYGRGWATRRHSRRSPIKSTVNRARTQGCLVPIVPSSVSVVIPAFRNQVVLDRTLATLLAQTVKAREIIVVDDGSETPLKVPKGVTLARIERKATYRGSSDAKNHGAALATGDYLAFSDSDILHMPDAIESVLAHFVKCENPRMLVNVFSLAMDAKPDPLVFDPVKPD